MKLWLPLVVVLLVGSAAGCGSRGDRNAAAGASGDEHPARDRALSQSPIAPLSVAPRMRGHARWYVDRKDRLRVKLPAAWHRATDRTTDRISLVEANLLAVGTFPIRPRPQHACSEDAAEPRVKVGPTDALIVVEEDVHSRADRARERPRFRLLEQVAASGKPRRARTGVFPAWNCRNEVGVSGLWEASFADRGRVFSVTAMIGKAATEKTRSETLAVLNSFEPTED